MDVTANSIKISQEFLGDAPMKLQTTNIQEIYNHYQHFDSEQLLVIDFRCKDSYNSSHIVDSINIPLDRFKITHFTNFNEPCILNNY